MPSVQNNDDRKYNGMISTEVVQVIPVGRRKAGISNNQSCWVYVARAAGVGIHRRGR